MPDNTTTTIDSTPDPQTQVLVYTGIRAVLQILGAFGVTWGAGVSQSTWQIVAGALAILIGTVWSFYQKFKAARLDHAGSVASARGGKAVKVIPTEITP